MKEINYITHPDVVLIYQDRDTVEIAIEQVMELDLQFKAYQFDQKNLHEITAMKPKVVLLSSNNVKNTIQLYIDYLEEYEKKIAPHSAILLINNRETLCAYLACEKGLFDNYVVINPLNEPYRLKLALLRELKMLNGYKNDGLAQLSLEGGDMLASCIEHGVTLKKSFLHEVQQCESSLLAAANKLTGNDEGVALLQKLIALAMDNMNEKLSVNIQEGLEKLTLLQTNSQALQYIIDKSHKPQSKQLTDEGISFLLPKSQHEKGKSQALTCKVLIAEPSELFSRVLDEMFSETKFDFLLVNEGEKVLLEVNNFNPDVILLAYDFSKINGLEITKRIRKEGNKTPIIAYTHNRDKGIIKNWIPLGISDYVIKPSKKSIILRSIIKAIKSPVEIIEYHDGVNEEGIRWIPKYSIGNKEIDDQHKMLFTITNEFFHQEGRESAIATFQNLSSYIDLHFEVEEALLKN